MNRRIVAGLAAASVSAVALPAQAQTQTQQAVITGRVTNAGTGQGIGGVTVAIPSLGVGTLTNDVGNYTLTVPAARVRGQSVELQARFIGYRRGQRTVTLAGGRTTENFTLEADANRLTEVVVTGVSVATERVKVPFTVNRVDSTSAPVVGVNPLTQLQGKVPGANIVAASGRPGAQPQVLLRGPKSINAAGRGQDPLYIVDGVILSSGQNSNGLADLNAADIESVEVVKGAAAASLYGSQAANGVIQITTKRGRQQRDGVRFGVRAEYGVNDIEREIPIAQRHALLMDPSLTRFCISNGVGTSGQVSGATCQRTINWQEESLRINDNTQDFASAPPQVAIDLGSGLQGASNGRRMFQTNPWPGANYNAVQQLVQPKPLALTNVDLTGKFGGADIYASVNRTQQGGSIAYLNGYTRNSARLNANQSIGSMWQIGVNTFFARAEEDGFNQQGGNGNAFFQLTRTPPIVNLLQTDSRGRLLVRPNIQGGGAQNANPLVQLAGNRRVDFTNRFVGSANVRFTPATWLNADANFGYDNSDQDGRRFQNRGFRTTGPNAAAANNGSLFNYATNARSLNGGAGFTLPNISPINQLQITPSARVIYLQQDYRDRTVSGSQLSVSGVEATENATQNTLSTTAQQTSVRQLSYVGGLRGEFKERYIIDASVRRDGNSTFGSDARWANYGRIAGAWIASSESFLQNVRNLDLVKFTANYGTSGLGPRFSAQYETFDIGSGGTLTPNIRGNPNLRPQVNAEAEFGFEVGAFNGLTLQTTYARSNTRDQILPVGIPGAQGFREQWTNAGTLRNESVEVSFGFPVFRRNGVNWTGRLNYERTVTTVAKLNVPTFYTGGSLQATEAMFRVAEGERFGTFYGRNFLTDCSQLDPAFVNQCGAGRAFQRNQDGLIVWTGEGNSINDGVTKNLWNANLPAAQAPWGVPVAWGHPIIQRVPNAFGAAAQVPLGRALPDFRTAASTNFAWRRLTAFALVDAAVGQSVYNLSRHWAYLDFLSRDQDQTGRAIGDVKPTSYYYRAGQPDNSAGIGGLYDVLGPNNYFTEKSSYAKLREVTLSYNVGRIVNAVRDLQIGVTGRNLYTWTKYRGFDPEVGIVGTQSGSFGSGALTAVDAFTFPNARTFSFNISTRF